MNAVKLDPNIIPDYEEQQRTISAKSCSPNVLPKSAESKQGASRTASSTSVPASRRHGKKAGNVPPVKTLEMPVQPLVSDYR